MKVSRVVTAAIAAMTACGVVGMVPPAVQASSAPTPTWTKQAPPVRPSARRGAAMAYDAATGTVVLFGGSAQGAAQLGDTWTWNGTTWTKQHLATHPSVRFGSGMAYDAAAGTTVLFNGDNGFDYLLDTWTWG